MTLEFFLAVALSLSVIAIVIMMAVIFRSNSRKTDYDDGRLNSILEANRELAELQRRQYEESSERVLMQTRDEYETRIEALEQRLERQAEELRRTSAIEFENLANRALERQAEKLADGNRDGIAAILDPLSRNIGDFRKAVNDSYIQENSSRMALSAQIESLIRANMQIGKETRRLSEALRGNTRFQGRLGETVLKRMLDSAGFINDVHYSTQVGNFDGRLLADDDANMQRPDLIFLLPSQTRVVIDAKTSLTAYLRYCDADSEEDESAALKAHVASVRNHIDKLGRAQYHKYIRGAMEHTLMFMPNDGAFLAAIRQDPELPEYALKKNVVIISPAHLLSILSLISQLFRIDNQNRNAEEIARLGGLLYDRIAAFLNEFDGIQSKLESAERALAKSRRTLSDGSQSVIARANRLKEMGAKTSRSLPPEYLSSDPDSD